MNQQPTCRDPEEVQRAHDILTAVYLGEVPIELTEAEKQEVAARCDVLCWALGHDHNQDFCEWLSRLEARIEAMGFRLHRHPTLRRRIDEIGEAVPEDD